MATIKEFVVHGAQTLTAGEIDSFHHNLAAYKLKAEALESNQPLIREQTAFLLRYIEDVLDNVYSSNDVLAVPEAIFAVRYLAKSVDIIPDSIPEMGYADDAAVLQTVIIRHETEFRDYCNKQKLDFDVILPQR